MNDASKKPGPLSAKFEQALLFALQLHAHQLRKGSSVPYAAHLLAVSALVLEAGGSEDEAIAGLLHDAVEDQGGVKTLDQIRKQFGSEVAAIVMACSDSFEIPKPPWRERKETYLAHLRDAPPAVCRVSLADKLHNARSIHRDLRQEGEELWQRFNGGKAGTLWYYSQLVGVFQCRTRSPLVDDFAEVVARIRQLAAGRSDGC